MQPSFGAIELAKRGLSREKCERCDGWDLGPLGLGREAVFSKHFAVTSLIFTRAL